MNNQIQRQSPRPDRYDDEISLVDLASILVKRWKAMAIIFAIIVLAALAYALMMPHTYSYTSLYNVAEQGGGEALEVPAALVAKASSFYLGQQTRALMASEGVEGLPFKTTISNPKNTLLLSLSTQADENDVGMVQSFHEGIFQRLEKSQQALVERRRETLKRQLESANEALEALRGSDNSNMGELISTYTSRIADLEVGLIELRKGEVSQFAVKSLEPTGTGRKPILALGIVLGGILALIGAFFMQFVSLVFANLKESK